MSILEFEAMFTLFVKKYNNNEINLHPTQAIHDLTAGINHYEKVVQGKNSEEFNTYAQKVRYNRNHALKQKQKLSY